MPKDTVREPRINLTSVKDHFKYFFGGDGGRQQPGWEGRQDSRGAPQVSGFGGTLRHGLVAVRGHSVPGEAESDPGRCFALLPKAPRQATPPAAARTMLDALCFRAV